MSYNQYQSNPYTQGPTNESGYGNGYGQQEQHEMQPYGQPYGQPYDQQPVAGSGAGAGHTAAPVLSQQDYLARVSHVRDEIRSLTADVQSIAGLHARALAGTDGAAQQQLEQLVARTQLKNTSIRDQIRGLKIDCERTTDGSRTLKTRQFDSLNNDFRKELQGYLQEEQQYKERYREQIARQYRIVNPDASEQEVAQATDQDWGNEGIFQTALRTNRSGQASAVLGAVRARHNELQKIEQSITELAGLFQDLDTLVVMQEATVVRAEEQTEQTNTHLQKGNEQVAQANEHARRRRRLKWICFFLVILIILAIALGVGLGVGLPIAASKTATGH